MSQFNYPSNNLTQALDAIITLNSGSSEPPATSPYMLWMDTSKTPAVLRQRNVDDTAWVDLFASNAVSTTPVGTVNAIAGANIPEGWLECNGVDISRTQYAELFEQIGTIYGEGDGSTTFALPDLRGEFIRGLDNGRGADASRVLGSGQDFAMENITGGFATFSWGGDNLIVNPYGAFVSDYKTGKMTSAHAGHGHSGEIQGASFDASRVAKTASETRPRNVAMKYIIKH